MYYSRLPEHCIEYVKVLQWSKENPWGPNTGLDGDDPQHVAWVHEKAQERAMKYGIANVTYRLTQGVLKNIIPAVASTNAAIAAACATEVMIPILRWQIPKSGLKLNKSSLYF